MSNTQGEKQKTHVSDYLLKIEIESFILRLFFNLLFALIIFSQAELGNLLGIRNQPLAISLIWPATGFSLAALLLFGQKVWPGIFFGNFGYNFFHLYLFSGSIIPPFITAFSISLGSLLQAFLGNYFLRRFCSIGYFNTVKDIIIFLIPGGLFTCLTASTIGTFSLYLFEPTSLSSVMTNWLIFWIGDLLGVYIFTPLLVVWALSKSLSRLKDYFWETLIIGLLLITVLYLTFAINHFFYHFYIPLALWSAYRFGMHGGTLILFIIALAIIIPTAVGFTVFDFSSIENPLLFLVIFLEILVVTTLFFAAIVNEKEKAISEATLIRENFHQTIKTHQDELKERDYQLFSKKILFRFKELILEATRWIRIPFSHLHALAQGSLESSRELDKIFQLLKDKLQPNTATHFQYHLENLDLLLSRLIKKETEAGKLIQTVEEKIKLSTIDKLKIQAVNMKVLLSQCLSQIMDEAEKKYPEFTFNLFEEFEEGVSIVLVAQEELRHAFHFLLTRGIHSMKTKKDRLGISYTPILKVRVKPGENGVEIMIRDNGLGASGEELTHFFSSFFTPPSEDLAEKLPENMASSFIYDLIVHVYQGSILVSSKENEYLQIDIKLPREAF